MKFTVAHFIELNDNLLLQYRFSRNELNWIVTPFSDFFKDYHQLDIQFTIEKLPSHY